MSQPKRKRRQPVIDTAVQGALLRQTVLHWSLLVIVASTLLYVWQILLGTPGATFAEHLGQMWLRYGPFYVVMMVLIPVVLYDSLRLTNRFAGPVFKLRRSLRQLAAGERVEPIRFRRGDFWHDMADSFNQLLEQFNQLQEPRTEQPDDRPELQSAELQSAELKSAELKSAERKSAELKGAELKSAERKSAELKGAERKSTERKSVESRDAERNAAELGRAGLKRGESGADSTPSQPSDKVPVDA